MSLTTCIKTFTIEVEGGVDCAGVPQSIADAVWTPAIGSVVFDVVSGDGTFNGVGSCFADSSTQICNPGLLPYDFTVDVAWSCGGYTFSLNTQAVVELNGVSTSGPVYNTNGARTFHFDGQLVSGQNTLRIYVPSTGFFGGTLSGTCTIRPLAPP